jgi:hypothetical protein
MKNLISAFGFLLISAVGVCQVVNIPDANFKNYLLNNLDINTNGDGEIQVAEAAAFTDTIAVDSLDIYDLTGIEAFTAITGLNCSGNQLSSLNVSGNTALTYLDFSSNHIHGVNLSANTALTYLKTAHNFLQQGLNVSSNTALVYLYCHNNSLNNLNLSANTALIELRCDGNLLMSLDVSANINLTLLSCCTNYLLSLDVSANTALTTLYLISNSLSSLNVQNGNNVNFSAFSAIMNYNLNCILVDDATWANAHWSNSVDNASFSEECNCSANFNLYPDSIPLNYIAENLATGTPPLAYVWNWGDGTYDSTAYPTHTYDIPGTYALSLTVTDATGCSDEYWHDYTFKTQTPIAYVSVIDGITGVEENNMDRLIVFPNPATTHLTLTTPTIAQTDYTLFDLSGRELCSGSFMQNTTITISDFAAGAYFVELRSEEGSSRQKFIKQ